MACKCNCYNEPGLCEYCEQRRDAAISAARILLAHLDNPWGVGWGYSADRLRAALAALDADPKPCRKCGWLHTCECKPAPSAAPDAGGDRCDYNAWCALPRAHKDGCLSEDEVRRAFGGGAPPKEGKP